MCSEHVLVKTQIKGDSHDSDAHPTKRVWVKIRVHTSLTTRSS